MHEIKLDDKELYVIWTIITWFNKPIVTDKMKYKLSGMASSELRPGLEKRFDKRIEDTIIELGKWLEQRRDSHDSSR